MMPLLHSKIIGEGAPLLILHGFLGMSDNWKSLGNLYAKKGWEVHLIDQRNHGKSFWSPTFNYDILTEDLRKYRMHYGLSKATIIGHSMGGKTAMHFACRYPEFVKKLVVADIAPKYYPPHHGYILNALNKLPLNELNSRGESDRELAKYLSDPGIRQFLLKNLYWVEKGRLRFRFNLEVLSKKMEEIGKNLGSTAIYSGPTLFLKGDRSEYIALNDFPEIKKHFPIAIIETVENAGHWLHAENPDQFFEKTVTFINS